MPQSVHLVMSSSCAPLWMHVIQGVAVGWLGTCANAPVHPPHVQQRCHARQLGPPLIGPASHETNYALVAQRHAIKSKVSLAFCLLSFLSPQQIAMASQLQGSPAVEAANDRFSATMTNVVRWGDAVTPTAASATPRRQLRSDTEIQVWVDLNEVATPGIGVSHLWHSRCAGTVESSVLLLFRFCWALATLLQ